MRTRASVLAAVLLAVALAPCVAIAGRDTGTPSPNGGPQTAVAAALAPMGHVAGHRPKDHGPWWTLGNGLPGRITSLPPPVPLRALLRPSDPPNTQRLFSRVPSGCRPPPRRL